MTGTQLADGLPADIVLSIARGYFGETEYSLVHWKNALSFLGVCRRWRASAIQLFYSFAYIAIPSVDYELRQIGEVSEAEGDMVPLTNIMLAKQNGYLHCVKHLVYSKTSFQGAGRMIMNSPDELFWSKSSFPGASSALAWLWADDEETVGENIRAEASEAARALAVLLAETLPNVIHLNINIPLSHPVFSVFAGHLVSSYAHQLKLLQGSMNTAFPQTAVMRHLDLLTLSIGQNSRIPLSFFDPRPIRRIYLVMNNVPFTWGMFAQDDSGAVAFDGLAYLSIACEDTENIRNDFEQRVSTANDALQLKFPALTEVYLKGMPLSPREMGFLMQGPMKRLTYAGTPASAMLLCEEIPESRLDKLMLKFDVGTNEPAANSEFVSHTNRIFSRARGIGRVHCRLQGLNESIVGRINWPCLTHLVLLSHIPFRLLLDALPRLPNLVSLKWERGFDEVEVTTVLECLPSDYNELSSSKIRLITAEVYFCIMCRPKAALNKLYQYLPKLQQIRISQNLIVQQYSDRRTEEWASFFSS